MKLPILLAAFGTCKKIIVTNLSIMDKYFLNFSFFTFFLLFSFSFHLCAFRQVIKLNTRLLSLTKAIIEPNTFDNKRNFINL